jgi:hypothetical protein
MERRPTKTLLLASFRRALFWALLLLVTAAATRLNAQQGLPLPPVFRDLAAVGVPVSTGQQASNTGANQQSPSGSSTPDPYHVFDNTVPGTAAKTVPGGRVGSEAPPKVLVLKNGRVVQGSIRTDSRGYFVESPRSSLYFPFEHVKFVAVDLHAAYGKLCNSITDHTVRRDLLLGRWCLENDLRPEAAAHFRNVLKIDATNREAKQWLAKLEQDQPPETTQERRRSTRPPNTDPQFPESLSRLSRSAVREFVIGIQPMLLARCGTAKCHGDADLASSSGSSFRLDNVRLSQGSNRAATARNLDAVLKMIDGQFPSQSPLFEKGLQSHGGLALRPPLDGPAGHAQEARLRRWVDAVAPEMNRLNREEATRKFVSRFSRSPKSPALHDPNVVPASATDQDRQDRPVRITNDRPVAAGAENQRGVPNGLGPLTDPFDPARFNSPQLGSPQLGSPQLNSPRLGSPQLNSPQLNSP